MKDGIRALLRPPHAGSETAHVLLLRLFCMLCGIIITTTTRPKNDDRLHPVRRDSFPNLSPSYPDAQHDVDPGT